MQSIKISISVVFIPEVYILMMPCGDPSHLLALVSLRVYLWSVWSGCERKYRYRYRGKGVSCENGAFVKAHWNKNVPPNGTLV
ncbi:hypothetical protein KSP39_PZI018026 [Platanthera zijinensis]|uniref:Uncharacterized protein n=1 Tax=Platanthera zijinensis TaxID=2320716 RepID=A0AAP0B4H4_9ASPA